MKQQLEQVNKERKDILLRETGWDTLVEEEQEDHPAFHNIDSPADDAASTNSNDYDSEADIGSDYDEEASLSPVNVSSPKRSEIPYTMAKPLQNEQLYTMATPLPQEPLYTMAAPVQSAAPVQFKIPSISDLLASVDVQVQRLQPQYNPQVPLQIPHYSQQVQHSYSAPYGVQQQQQS